MPCACRWCWRCHGTGNLVFGPDTPTPPHRTDDLDTVELCDVCGGRGVAQMCARCRDRQADDDAMDAATA